MPTIHLTNNQYKNLYDNEKLYMNSTDGRYGELQGKLERLHDEYERRMEGVLASFYRHMLNSTMNVVVGDFNYARMRLSNLTNMRLKDRGLKLVTFPNPNRITNMDDMLFDMELIICEMLMEEEDLIRLYALDEMALEERRVNAVLLSFGSMVESHVTEEDKDGIFLTGVMGISMHERLWGKESHRSWLVESMNKVARKTLQENFDIIEINKDVARAFKSNSGIMVGTVLTEMNRVQSQVRGVIYEKSRVLKYRYVAEHDAKTCSQCEALDGQEFLVTEREEGVNAPTMHFRCRCTDYPISVETE